MVDDEKVALLMGVPLNVAVVSWNVESNVQRYSPDAGEFPSNVVPDNQEISHLCALNKAHDKAALLIDVLIVCWPHWSSIAVVATNVGSERK